MFADTFVRGTVLPPTTFKERGRYFIRWFIYNMRYVSFIYAFLALCLVVPEAHADIAVVVNPQNQIKKLSKREVTDLFMGRYVAFPDGMIALPLDLPVGSPVRGVFYKSITGKSVAQINAYWAKLIFSGRATPPRVAPGQKEVTNMVVNNKNAIAYMDVKDVTSKVKIVYLIKSKR